MEAISDAVVDEIKLYYRGYENTPATPAIGSEVAQFVGLYYSNEGEFDAVFIPAPKPSLYETVGPYAGIRVDTSNPTVLALLESLNLALATAGASVSFPLGSGFMAGGRVL